MRILIALAGSAGGVLLLWLVFGFLVFQKFLSRKAADPCREMAKKWTAGEATDPNSPDERFLIDWALAHHTEPVSMQSRDGLKLIGTMFRQSQPGSPWVILVHGYTCNKETMAYAAQKFYDEMGWNVLAVDLRGHGESEGKTISMGWLDRLDLTRWTEWLAAQNPGCDITLFGISMGAATVMMTSGEQLPAAVKSIVADCGYTSAADVFAHNAKVILHLPAWFVLPPANLFSRLLAGFDFWEASALEQVRKNTRPLFLIHGGSDNFVPTKMIYPLHEAAGGDVRMLVVPGAGHGEAVQKDDTYWAQVFAFVGAQLDRVPERS
ncbi:MAG: alpha/beta hydrolase [Oscillospiraceae bacterium]|nr:alpha/beta hydrolase [Oscillospiraceae bacterium]